MASKDILATAAAHGLPESQADAFPFANLLSQMCHGLITNAERGSLELRLIIAFFIIAGGFWLKSSFSSVSADSPDTNSTTATTPPIDFDPLTVPPVTGAPTIDILADSNNPPEEQITRVVYQGPPLQRSQSRAFDEETTPQVTRWREHIKYYANLEEITVTVQGIPKRLDLTPDGKTLAQWLKKYGYNLSILEPLIMIESNGRDAESPVGASCHMQVMPFDTDNYPGLFLGRPTRQELHDNIDTCFAMGFQILARNIRDAAAAGHPDPVAVALGRYYGADPTYADMVRVLNYLFNGKQPPPELLARFEAIQREQENHTLRLTHR